MTLTTFFLKTLAPIAAVGIAITTFAGSIPRVGLVKSLKRALIAAVVTTGMIAAYGIFWTVFAANFKFSF